MDVRIRKRWLWLWGPVCLGALSLPARPAVGEDAGPADAPSGTVAFFSREDATCPTGWRVATEASGRLLVGVTSGDSVGKLVGTALTNQEDRTHVHAFTATADLPYKSLSALDGGNGQGAKAQKYMDGGDSDPAPTGLPFVQLVVCVKQ